MFGFPVEAAAGVKAKPPLPVEFLTRALDHFTSDAAHRIGAGRGNVGLPIESRTLLAAATNTPIEWRGQLAIAPRCPLPGI